MQPPVISDMMEMHLRASRAGYFRSEKEQRAWREAFARTVSYLDDRTERGLFVDDPEDHRLRQQTTGNSTLAGLNSPPIAPGPKSKAASSSSAPSPPQAANPAAAASVNQPQQRRAFLAMDNRWHLAAFAAMFQEMGVLVSGTSDLSRAAHLVAPWKRLPGVPQLYDIVFFEKTFSSHRKSRGHGGGGDGYGLSSSDELRKGGNEEVDEEESDAVIGEAPPNGSDESTDSAAEEEERKIREMDATDEDALDAGAGGGSRSAPPPPQASSGRAPRSSKEKATKRHLLDSSAKMDGGGKTAAAGNTITATTRSSLGSVLVRLDGSSDTDRREQQGGVASSRPESSSLPQTPQPRASSSRSSLGLSQRPSGQSGPPAIGTSHEYPAHRTPQPAKRKVGATLREGTSPSDQHNANPYGDGGVVVHNTTGSVNANVGRFITTRAAMAAGSIGEFIFDGMSLADFIYFVRASDTAYTKENLFTVRTVIIAIIGDDESGEDVLARGADLFLRRPLAAKLHELRWLLCPPVMRSTHRSHTLLCYPRYRQIAQLLLPEPPEVVRERRKIEEAKERDAKAMIRTTSLYNAKVRLTQLSRDLARDDLESALIGLTSGTIAIIDDTEPQEVIEDLSNRLSVIARENKRLRSEHKTARDSAEAMGQQLRTAERTIEEMQAQSRRDTESLEKQLFSCRAQIQSLQDRVEHLQNAEKESNSLRDRKEDSSADRETIQQLRSRLEYLTGELEKERRVALFRQFRRGPGTTDVAVQAGSGVTMFYNNRTHAASQCETLNEAAFNDLFKRLEQSEHAQERMRSMLGSSAEDTTKQLEEATQKLKEKDAIIALLQDKHRQLHMAHVQSACEVEELKSKLAMAAETIAGLKAKRKQRASFYGEDDTAPAASSSSSAAAASLPDATTLPSGGSDDAAAAAAQPRGLSRLSAWKMRKADMYRAALLSTLTQKRQAVNAFELMTKELNHLWSEAEALGMIPKRTASNQNSATTSAITFPSIPGVDHVGVPAQLNQPTSPANGGGMAAFTAFTSVSFSPPEDEGPGGGSTTAEPQPAQRPTEQQQQQYDSFSEEKNQWQSAAATHAQQARNLIFALSQQLTTPSKASLLTSPPTKFIAGGGRASRRGSLSNSLEARPMSGAARMLPPLIQQPAGAAAGLTPPSGTAAAPGGNGPLKGSRTPGGRDSLDATTTPSMQQRQQQRRKSSVGVEGGSSTTKESGGTRSASLAAQQPQQPSKSTLLPFGER